MDDQRWEKLAAGTGIAFVVLIVASAFVVPEVPPKIEDPIGKIGRFYFDNHNALLWGGWLGLLGSLFGLWFIGTVAHWVRRQNQPRLATIAFGGGVVSTALGLMGGLLGTLLAYLVSAPDDVGPGVARALFDGSSLTFAFLWIPTAVFVAAVSMAGMRSGSLPAWLWGSGGVFAVLAVVASAAVFAHSGAFAPGGLLQLVPFLIFALWSLALSIVLLRRVGTESAGGADRPLASTAG